MNYPVDKSGVPIINRSEIERRAIKFLEYFREDCLKHPQMAPLGTICKSLSDEHGVKFIYQADLGSTPQGYKYRGRFHLPTTTIYIDKSLEPFSPRFNFTLAHELGHFVFHRKLDLSNILKNEDIVDTSRDLILDQMDENNPRTWLEWQANKFASSLLMPAHPLKTAVISKQMELGITRNRGKIYLSRSKNSYSDYNQQIDHLIEIFQTSKSSLRLRLKELFILNEPEVTNTDTSKPKKLNQHMASVLKKWEENV
ncbi:MAG: ImmA/IrrE family metallo-endopeptidase [Candidatus Thiodiazotropha sp. (ex Notomyrtea botanica)]|nr:ImmA/IrrE family metallo-endopeptidase [Candidatus Thiodiazotropha sp. (ex Notomyrtea botanica)]